MLVDFLVHYFTFLQRSLHHLSAFQIEGGSLDVFHALVGIGAEDTFRHRARFALEIGIGTATWFGEGKSRDCQTTDIIAYRHVSLVGNDHLSETCAAGFQHLDTPFLTVVYQKTGGLHRVFHVGQSAEHHSLSAGLFLVGGHLHLLLGGLAELHVHVLCRSRHERAHQHNE